MKKMFVLIAVAIMSQLAFAQEKQDTTLNKTRSGVFKKHHKGERYGNKEMMKELNLTETQKTQLKEMKMANKEKRDAILKDTKLTQEQKHSQLKELHQSNTKSMQAILTEEQKVKMKAAKEKRKAERQNDPKWKSKKKNSVDSTKQ